MQTKRNKFFMIAFLVTQLMLYALILTSGGKVLIWSEFSAIVLCFLFTLVCFKASLVIAGLGLTVCADFCLVICNPIEQLRGMVFFLGAQILYAVFLHRQSLPKGLLMARLALTIAVEAAAILILRENTDALAMVSMLYYANLIMNMVCAFTRFRNNRLLAIGFALFILCDTIVGLQVATDGYLPISEDSIIHKLIFSGFHLSWFFYLPSQVLIAFSARRE